MFRERIHPDWPSHSPKLSSLNQGDVVADVPTSYLAFGEIRACSDSPQQSSAFVAVQLDYAPYAIITTQSCDLVEEGPTPIRPFFSAAPVYELVDLSPEQKIDIEKFRVTYLVKLTGSAFQNGFWVADLRVQTSFDKGLLLGREVFEGFANAADRERFAEQVSWQYGRPAFPREIAEHLVNSLRQWLYAKPTRRARMRDLHVEEFRVRCSAMTPPCNAELLVLVDDPNDVKPVQEFFNAWYISAARNARAAGITLTLKVEFLDQITGREYRSAQPLSIG